MQTRSIEAVEDTRIADLCKPDDFCRCWLGPDCFMESCQLYSSADVAEADAETKIECGHHDNRGTTPGDGVAET